MNTQHNFTFTILFELKIKKATIDWSIYKTENELNKIKLFGSDERKIMANQLHMKINKINTITDAKEIKLALFLFIIINYNVNFWYDINCSNLTRTFPIGKPHPRLIDAYNVVLRANREGIKKLVSSIKGNDLDKNVEI